MENRRFDPEGQDDSTPEASSNKKKRGSSAVSRILAGLKRKEQEENAESDSSDEKPKRFRRIFNKLFPNVVEKPESSSSELANQGFDPETWFSWTQLVDRKESAGEQTEEADNEQLVASTTKETAETQQEPARVEEVESQSVTNSEDTPHLPDGPELESDIDPVTPELPEPEQAQGELFIRHDDRIEAPRLSSATEKEPKEVVIERGPGMVLPVALVGLEHLGRKKADRKLEKRVNEKISATNKEVERSIGLQQELETLRRQNNEQLEALKQARVERPIESARPQEKNVERAPAPRVERLYNPEQPMFKAKERPQTVVEQQVREEIKPEGILEQVADAAEHDLPVERIFERSHEVKDDNIAPVGAASIGSVVSTHAAASQYQALQQTQSTAQLTDEPSRLVTHENDPVAIAAYKQAIKLGFWAAIMIIVLGSIAYLVVK